MEAPSLHPCLRERHWPAYLSLRGNTLQWAERRRQATGDRRQATGERRTRMAAGGRESQTSGTARAGTGRGTGSGTEPQGPAGIGTAVAFDWALAAQIVILGLAVLAGAGPGSFGAGRPILLRVLAA